MQESGESIQQTGVYSSSCCGIDIVAPRGEHFPLCPGCGRHTSWQQPKPGARGMRHAPNRLVSQPEMESLVMGALTDLGEPALSLSELTVDQGLWLAQFRLEGSLPATHYLAWHFADDLSGPEVQRRLAEKLRAELDGWKKKKAAE